MLDQPTMQGKITAQDIMTAIHTGFNTVLESVGRGNGGNEMPLVWNQKIMSGGGDEIFTVRGADWQTFKEDVAHMKEFIVESVNLRSAPPQKASVDHDAWEETEEPAPQQQTKPGPLAYYGECPKCGSEVWDNRNDPRRKPNAPLVKCKNQECDWRMWAPRKKGDRTATGKIRGAV